MFITAPANEGLLTMMERVTSVGEIKKLRSELATGI